VFHFGIDEFGEQLKTLELNEPIFVSAMGKENGQVYYELADLCAARAFSKPLPQDGAAALAAIGQRAEATSDLIVGHRHNGDTLPQNWRGDRRACQHG
jgi:hypothetical protein